MKVLHGIAVNDSDYITRSKNFKCPYYAKWEAMITRCYRKPRKAAYKDCKVCDEWLTFSAFRSWMETQNWEGKELDKDLLGSGKIYDPESCVFVSKEINMFFVTRSKSSGLPLGVTSVKGKHYRSSISNPGRVGKGSIYLGLYPTQQEAHRAWQIAKLDRLRELIKTQEDQRVINGLEIREKILEKDLQDGKETINL